MPEPRTLLPVLVLMSMIGPLALNILMPVMPRLGEALGAGPAAVQLTLAVFLVAQAVAQLVIGPLADRYGRRPVLLLALALFVVASLAAALAANLGFLLVARVLQAVGGSAGLAIGRTVVRDLYPEARAASMIGYVTMAMVVAPMVAPTLGAQLDRMFGWPSLFLACAALGGASLILSHRQLPETRPDSARGQTAAEIARRSVDLLRRPRFLGYALGSAFATCMFMAFLGASPHLVVSVMGRDPQVYATWFVILSLGYIVGNYLSGRYAQRLGIDRMVALGNMVGLVGGAALLAGALAGWLTPASLFLPFALISIANGLVLPNAIAGAVGLDPKAAGTASGLVGFLQFGLGGLVSFVAGLVTGPSALPLGLIVVACGLLALVTARLTERP